MSTTSEDLLRQQRRAGIPTTRRTAVYVYQAPLRAWHWINALSITILAITGHPRPPSCCHDRRP